jgi:glutathione synthase/RimK-type ligase-like ATP-grasp enzyme
MPAAAGQRRLAIAMSRQAPTINADDEAWIESLRTGGIAITTAIWNDAAVDWSGFDAVLMRSIWDYFRHYGQFLDWLARLEALGVPTINPNHLLRWNSDKRYLLQLPPLGVDIIPTQVVPARGLSDALARMSGTQVVIKPAVSGSSWHTIRAIAGSEQVNAAIESLPAGLDYLVQPFVPEIAQEGEWSILFFGGVYSHAVRKRPAANDYRVQREFGGSVEILAPPPRLLAAAKAALDAVTTLGYPDGSYARIDGVRRGDDFLVMEVEMIEPFLFLGGIPAASERFAAVITERLHLLRPAGR